MKTDKELKEIATDLYKEKIFSDRHLHNRNHELAMVFIALLFLEEEHYNKMEDEEIVFIYEYIEKSTGVAVNGYPTFMSFRSLNKKEYEKMINYYNEIKTAVSDI